jgi:hypothetical protein
MNNDILYKNRNNHSLTYIIILFFCYILKIKIPIVNIIYLHIINTAFFCIYHILYINTKMRYLTILL